MAAGAGGGGGGRTGAWDDMGGGAAVDGECTVGGVRWSTRAGWDPEEESEREPVPCHNIFELAAFNFNFLTPFLTFFLNSRPERRR